MTLVQAMRGYTREGAYAGFNEDRMGLIAPGLLADLVVWDSDLLAIDSHLLLKAKVLRTVVEGIQRYGCTACPSQCCSGPLDPRKCVNWMFSGPIGANLFWFRFQPLPQLF